MELGDLMKIVFYNKFLLSGGIEKCIELLSKYIYKDYELEVVYSDSSKLDPNIVSILERYAKVYELKAGMNIECDICIWCYLYFDYYKLKSIIHAREYIAWIHSMPRILPDCLLDNVDFVNDCSKFICVSEAVKRHLEISKEGEVIHNFMDESIKELGEKGNPFEGINEDILKLAVVSRLSNGKGFERLLNLVKSLKANEIPFKLIIVGKGRAKEAEIRSWFEPYEEVEFAGYQENPYPYVKNADYLVQLSDDESWCNSITEAKILGVPVVVTNFESSYEQVKDGKNGIIVDLDIIDYTTTIDRMIGEKSNLKRNLVDFEFHNEISKWYDIFNEIEK